MAAHASIPAWRVPWTEEPGGYSPRVTKSRTRRKQQHAQNVPVAEPAPVPFSLHSAVLSHAEPKKGCKRFFLRGP